MAQRADSDNQLLGDEREDIRDYSRGKHGQPRYHNTGQSLDPRAAKERENRKQLNLAKKLTAGSQLVGAIGSITGNQTLTNLGQLGKTAAGGTEGYAEGAKRGMSRAIAAQGAYYGAPRVLKDKYGMGNVKAGAAGGAARAAIQGDGVGGVAEGAAAGALSTKKFQQYKLIFQVLKGVKIGAAATVVGIIITIVIWLFQIFMSKVLGRKEWELAWWEKIIAYPICFLLFATLVTFAAIIYQLYDQLKGLF